MPPSTASLTACSEGLSELVARAGARARATGRSVLATRVEEIAARDPLDALAAAVTGTGVPRMYWTRPADNTAVAALGAALVLSPPGATRFSDADHAWQALLADAVVDDASGAADGTGPLLVGGFGFEAGAPATPPWQDFPAARLWVPRVQLATAGGRHWLTTTALIGPEGASDAGVVETGRLRGLLMGDATPAVTRGRVLRSRSLPEGVRFSDVLPPAEWKALVGAALEEIRRGTFDKVVLARARRAEAAESIDAYEVLAHLRNAHPDCCVFGCWSGDSVFLGASPERLVRLQGSVVSASSLAGSAPRGATPDDDAMLAAALLTSAKDRAEHVMVRDALCTALEALCDDIAAPAEPSLLSLPHVHHLHTAVRARLRDGGSLLALVAALHPTPAVGGAPRPAALQFIRDRERLDRGWYAAPVGWVGRDGGEFAVALRSALVCGREAWLFAGCGIVRDSDPEAEFAETLLKFRPMEQALAARARIGA